MRPASILICLLNKHHGEYIMWIQDTGDWFGTTKYVKYLLRELKLFTQPMELIQNIRDGFGGSKNKYTIYTTIMRCWRQIQHCQICWLCWLSSLLKKHHGSYITIIQDIGDRFGATEYVEYLLRDKMIYKMYGATTEHWKHIWQHPICWICWSKCQTYWKNIIDHI